MISPEKKSLLGSGRLTTELGLFVAILFVIGFTCLFDRSYLNKPGINLEEISRQTALLGIFALGAAIVIISGGIDLSSGSVIAFSGAICAGLIFALAPKTDAGVPNTDELPVWVWLVAILGTLAVGLLVGTVHTWLITVIGLPPFIATLGSLVGLRSLAKLLVQDINLLVAKNPSGSQFYINDERFRMLGKSPWIPVVIFLLLAFLTWVVMSRTVLGRHLYAMGGNEQAAKLSGIRTDRLKWFAYCFGTLTASISGIILMAYLGAADPSSIGMGYELNAIAAAVVGGCSLQGGIGTVLGTVLGALFLRVVIHSVSKIIDVKPDDFQGLVIGILVVLAVAFNELRSSGLQRKKFFPGALGIANLLILSVLTGVITLVMAQKSKLLMGCIGTVATFVVLGAKAWQERLSDSRH